MSVARDGQECLSYILEAVDFASRGLEAHMHLSGYRFMWVVVMFDLPVDTKKARRHYSQFRKGLLKDGFTMMQFSVYCRHCSSKENADVHVARVQRIVPPDGEVRVLTITDKQFERMRVFWGKRRKPTEKPPSQLEFF